MSADAKILEPDNPVTLEIRCYNCSNPVNKLDPIRGHTNCLSEDGQLYVNFDTENMEEL